MLLSAACSYYIRSNLQHFNKCQGATNSAGRWHSNPHPMLLYGSLSQFLPRCPFSGAVPYCCWVWASTSATFGRGMFTGRSWFGWAVYYPAGMFGALMEPRAYKTAWWAVPTGFEASVAQLAAPGADCIHSCFPVLLCPVPGTSEANAIDEEPPGLL